MNTAHQSQPYTLSTLSNGVRFLLVPMDGVNSIASSVMVGVGSRYEEPEISGISHFLEHMVFKGTAKYPTTDDVNIVERIGGLQNAYTDIDITNYHNKVLSEDWELGLEINKELAIHPLLEQKHVDRERDVIIEEMKRYEDEPSIKAEETLHEMMYPGTKLGMRTIGTAESLSHVAGGELRSYHDQWYEPSRIVVVLAGDLKTQISNVKITSQNSIVESKVQEWFGGLKKKETGDIERVSIVQTKPKVEVVTKSDVQQAHVFLGLRIFPRGSDERFAWNLFNLIMGVSFTSRLFKEIREKRGLCYHIRSSANNWVDTGYWDIYAGVATNKVEEAVKATLFELGKAVSGGVTEEEITVAKKRLKTMLAFKSEDPEFLNEYYGRQVLFGDPVVTLEDYTRKIDAVGKTNIDALVKKYLKTETLNMSIVWNKPKDENLVNLLKI